MADLRRNIGVNGARVRSLRTIGLEREWSGCGRLPAWLLQRTDAGCRVLTEETEAGWLARLQNRFRPERMHEQHQKWREGLEATVKAGKP